ncbi:hypothetical protein K469DRAFT_607743 [Zopfia rhizophila CBS 207.26]|uniref:E3 SUMO-protein ligase PIAS1 n=1 Tax=Zopfia rhizophila CBS 207.26 TaxID=1314779 RepID=A0A6A6D9X8_9PEZI|nr:hypothetical protein K469DRAFT_607743 [Zopfia rhizophila CBS 207.26]
MASNGNTIQQLAAALIARSKTLVNNDLKRICKEEGQIQSGNKLQLQQRVLDSTLHLIERAVQRNDLDSLQRLRYRIQHHGEAPPPDYNAPAPPSLPNHASPTAHGAYEMQNGYVNHQPYNAYPQQMAPRTPQYFKESPFYEFLELLVSGMTLEISPSHRQTTTRHLPMQGDLAQRLKDDLSLRIMLFSAIDAPLTQYSRQDVAFPSQIEVRINGEEVKANYKGLKNKPGSTRPADLTDYIRKTQNYRNQIVVTYALTQKASRHEKYNIFIYLVKKHSVEELAKRIAQRHVISKQSVINEMLRKANDPDIVVDSTVMSLKDPISTLRMTLPCRSNLCNHNQCFDAESFLQLQEQAPTWQCPVCNKTVSFEGLAVDQYVQEILESVPKGTDQVTIEHNGKWSHGSKTESQTPRNGFTATHDDSDDDLIEIPDYRVAAIKSEAVNTPQSLTRTPPLSSREASTAPRTGSKRTSEVIDLTLSDDDEPPRPTKKVAYSTPNSLPDPSCRYQYPTFGSSSAPIRPQPQHPNSMSSGMRLDYHPPSQNHSPYGAYREPPPRPSYLGQGTGTYPDYGSSP